MKKLLLTATLVIAAVLTFQSNEDVHAFPRMFFPTNHPTTIITPPKGVLEPFTVRIPANGNAVYIMFSPMCSPLNRAVPQVWVNGKFTRIYIGSRHRIEAKNIDQAIDVLVKYNSPTQEDFDVVYASQQGPSGYLNSSFEGVYSNKAPNNDRAMIIICDSASCE